MAGESHGCKNAQGYVAQEGQAPLSTDHTSKQVSQCFSFKQYIFCYVYRCVYVDLCMFGAVPLEARRVHWIPWC